MDKKVKPLEDEELRDVNGGIFGGVYSFCGHLIVTPFYSCDEWKPSDKADPQKFEMNCGNCVSFGMSGVVPICTIKKR